MTGDWPHYHAAHHARKTANQKCDITTSPERQREAIFANLLPHMRVIDYISTSGLKYEADLSSTWPVFIGRKIFMRKIGQKICEIYRWNLYFQCILAAEDTISSSNITRNPRGLRYPNVTSLYFATPLSLTNDIKGFPRDNITYISPERDCVMFGSLLSTIRLSSITFVRPTQGLKLSAIFLCHFVP